MTTPQEDAGLHDVFTAELLDRVTWFVRERWLAGAGLVAVALFAPPAGLPASWRHTWVVAVLVLAYNSFFARVISVRTRSNRVDYRWLARCTLFQIVLDLAAVMVLILLTGGVSSPFSPFFVFHMVIGTIMLSARTMLIVAGAVWSVFTAAFVAFPRLEGSAVVTLPPPAALAVVIVLAFTLGLTVVLTDTVASRFKERGVQLYRLTGELRRKTAELEKLLGTLRAVEERKSHFMLLSAHQLRSPLGTVRTSLDVLRQGYVDTRSERGRRLLDGARERVDGLLAIVNDLLELAKAKEGRDRAPWASNVNLKQLLMDILDEFSTVAEERGLRVVSELGDNAVLARGIPPDLVYAMENLVDNALKYSDRGGEVRVVLRVEGSDARVEVSDEGIGIPPEFQPSLFSEFSRAPNARERTEDGTGLGLAIVREVAEAHGGRVTVSSRLGQGSRFELVLPLAGGVPPMSVTEG